MIVDAQHVPLSMAALEKVHVIVMELAVVMLTGVVMQIAHAERHLLHAKEVPSIVLLVYVTVLLDILAMTVVVLRTVLHTITALEKELVTVMELAVVMLDGLGQQTVLAKHH